MMRRKTPTSKQTHSDTTQSHGKQERKKTQNKEEREMGGIARGISQSSNQTRHNETRRDRGRSRCRLTFSNVDGVFIVQTAIE